MAHLKPSLDRSLELDDLTSSAVVLPSLKSSVSIASQNQYVVEIDAGFTLFDSKHDAIYRTVNLSMVFSQLNVELI
jgi:hypothetical protein